MKEWLWQGEDLARPWIKAPVRDSLKAELKPAWRAKLIESSSRDGRRSDGKLF